MGSLDKTRDVCAGLESFLQGYQIPYATPSSPTYPSLRAAYITSFESVIPLCIVRPRNPNEVALVVKHVISNSIQFAIRAGGHDLFGRCFREAAVTIDLRDLNSVKTSTNRRSATIGGGVLAERVAEELGRVGLMTALGSFASVGYVGWATHGGYGQFAANYGLGVDQILGAIIVNCEGDIVEADEAMLEVIRGAGGTIGVVVEMTIAVYPLKEVRRQLIESNYWLFKS